MIQKLLLSIQMICKMFTKILIVILDILIVFDDMITDMINNKKLNSVVMEMFIKGRKLNFLLFLLCNHTLEWQKMLD